MELGQICAKCSGLPLDKIIAENLDPSRACLCFDNELTAMEESEDEDKEY